MLLIFITKFFTYSLFTQSTMHKLTGSSYELQYLIIKDNDYEQKNYFCRNSVNHIIIITCQSQQLRVGSFILCVKIRKLRKNFQHHLVKHIKILIIKLRRKINIVVHNNYFFGKRITKKKQQNGISRNDCVNFHKSAQIGMYCSYYEQL